jgi:hypothetical protein
MMGAAMRAAMDGATTRATAKAATRAAMEATAAGSTTSPTTPTFGAAVAETGAKGITAPIESRAMPAVRIKAVIAPAKQELRELYLALRRRRTLDRGVVRQWRRHGRPKEESRRHKGCTCRFKKMLHSFLRDHLHRYRRHQRDPKLRHFERMPQLAKGSAYVTQTCSMSKLGGSRIELKNQYGARANAARERSPCSAAPHQSSLRVERAWLDIRFEKGTKCGNQRKQDANHVNGPAVKTSKCWYKYGRPNSTRQFNKQVRQVNLTGIENR